MDELTTRKDSHFELCEEAPFAPIGESAFVVASAGVSMKAELQQSM